MNLLAKNVFTTNLWIALASGRNRNCRKFPDISQRFGKQIGKTVVDWWLSVMSTLQNTYPIVNFGASGFLPTLLFVKGLVLTHGS